ELTQHERHHDRVAAFGAGLGCERGKITGDEHLGVASAAGDHFQRSAHGYIIASTIPATNLPQNRPLSGLNARNSRRLLSFSRAASKRKMRNRTLPRSEE